MTIFVILDKIPVISSYFYNLNNTATLLSSSQFYLIHMTRRMPGDAVWKWEEITLTKDNFFLIGSMMYSLHMAWIDTYGDIFQ